MLKLNEILNKIDLEGDYTLAEVANLTGVSYSCIIGHIKRGNIESKSVFGKQYINGRTLIDYLTIKKT